MEGAAATPARAHQTGAGDSAIPRCSKVCVLGVAVCDARRSRRADPALERETNKIIKDDRRVRRARIRTPRRLAPTPATDVSVRRSL